MLMSQGIPTVNLFFNAVSGKAQHTIGLSFGYRAVPVHVIEYYREMSTLTSVSMYHHARRRRA